MMRVPSLEGACAFHSCVPPSSCCLSWTIARRLPWQRIFALQVLRGVAADPPLLAQMFAVSDMNIHTESNAVQDMAAMAVDCVRVGRPAAAGAPCFKARLGFGGPSAPAAPAAGTIQRLTDRSSPAPWPITRLTALSPYGLSSPQTFIRQGVENPEEELMEATSAYYRARADGKDTMPEGDALGEMLRQGDVRSRPLTHPARASADGMRAKSAERSGDVGTQGARSRSGASALR